MSVVHINFDAIYALLNNAIIRADAFMGIGLNAAEQQPRISHVLSLEGFQNTQLVKTDLSDGEAEHVAEEFGKWIRANGIRELMETFSIFMTQIYEVIHIIAAAKGEPFTFSVARFERLGIANQVARLRNSLEISDERAGILSSLNQARNCYAHRRGVVGPQDADFHTSIFQLSWLALEAHLQLPDGTVIAEDQLIGTYLPEGGAISVSAVLRTREFKLGEELILSKPDLKGICLTIYWIGSELWKRAGEFALAAGAIPIPPAEPLATAQVPA